MSTFLYKTLLGATATGALLLTANLAAQASSLQRGENISPSAIAAQFNLPGDAVPSTSIGGGTRGNVQFGLPDGATPSTSIGGGTRGGVTFGLPDGATPSTSIGGGTRGSVTFGLPDGATPSTSIGGGTRGSVQFGLPDGATPSTSIGGGTREGVQFGLPGGSTPTTGIGAGTREGGVPLLTALVPPTQHGNTVSVVQLSLRTCRQWVRRKSFSACKMKTAMPSTTPRCRFLRMVARSRSSCQRMRQN
jgi:hypothetical protein